jgi:aliphatic nitrilase
MVWGWGDGSGLKVFNTAVGRLGALICWEHFMPLARYALIAQNEEIHCAHFPGSMVGETLSRQMDAAIRHHAMEAGAFVVNATAWLTPEQRSEIAPDESLVKYLNAGICSAIVAPHGRYLAGPLPEGEGVAVAEIDLNAITRTKSILDTAGHYSRPDILQLRIDRRRRTVMDDFYPTREKLGENPFSPEEERADQEH